MATPEATARLALGLVEAAITVEQKEVVDTWATVTQEAIAGHEQGGITWGRPGTKSKCYKKEQLQVSSYGPVKNIPCMKISQCGFKEKHRNNTNIHIVMQNPFIEKR